VATANYMFWGAITGDPMLPGTNGPNGPDTIKTKAEIVKYLKDSYAIGHKAAGMLTAENIVGMVKIMMSPNPCHGCLWQHSRWPRIRPLRTSGGIPAHERHHPARQPQQ